MTSRIGKGAGLLAAVVGAGIFLAPGALAAPSPPVPPGPPPGYDGLPYHNMPGRIGHQPGAYTYILGFWMRPRRVLDAAGTGAMTNTDSASAEYGMPGSELGVEPLRNSTLGSRRACAQNRRWTRSGARPCRWRGARGQHARCGSRRSGRPGPGHASTTTGNGQ